MFTHAQQISSELHPHPNCVFGIGEGNVSPMCPREVDIKAVSGMHPQARTPARRQWTRYLISLQHYSDLLKTAKQTRKDREFYLPEAVTINTKAFAQWHRA